MATKRVADMTPEEAEKERERSRLNQRKRRASRTEEERIEENKKNNQRMKEYLSNMSSEEKEEYNKHRRELRAARIAKMTPEELAEMKRKKSEKAKQYRLSLTDEQKEKIRERDRLLHKKLRENITVEQKQRQREWIEKNKERIRKNHREWRKKNKDKVKVYKQRFYREHKEYRKIYYMKNKDKFKEYRNRYYTKNKDKVKQRREEYYKKNIEKIKSKQNKYYNCIYNEYEKYADKLLPEDGAVRDANGFIMVKCFHTGERFYPKRVMLLNRIRSINNLNAGENHFYISEEAKKACPVYHANPNWDPYRREKQQQIPLVDPLWRKTVIEHANGHCERCGKASDVLHAHHIIPKGVCGMLEEDFDNGMALCPECHREVHSTDGCRLHELAAEKRKAS